VGVADGTSDWAVKS